jgi:hypothetical protein
VVALESGEKLNACSGGGRQMPIKIGGSGKLKIGKRTIDADEAKRRRLGTCFKDSKAAASLAIEQGYPGLDKQLPALTVAARCQALGNGVPRIAGEAIARAIAAWEDER